MYKFVLTLCLISIPIFGVLWVLSVPQYIGLSMVTQQAVAIVLGLAVAAGLLTHPYFPKFPIIDFSLALLAVASWFWYAWNFEPWMVLVAYRTPDMWIPGLIGLFLLVEALRKSMGIILAALIWVVVAYGLWGDLIPGTLQASVFAPTRAILYLYADSNGVPGLVLTVILTLVLPFIVFGKMLEFSGGMKFFNDLAIGLVGHRRGGPAKVAIVASGFFGTLSGSTVANIMSTGIFTIPLMVKTGYTRVQAAAIEAVASNGGQIAPPIMGATAFIMAEFLGVPYSEIAMAATIPAILYFTVLFFKVDALAIRNGLKGMPREELPDLKNTLKTGWKVVLPIMVLLYLLFWTGYNPGLCALIATGVMLISHFITQKFHLDLKELFEAFVSIGKEFFPLLLIGGAAGIVIGLMNSTGFAFQLSIALTNVAESYGLLALLLLAAFVSIILGMGMPTAAVYIVLVTVVAPAVIQFGVEPLSAHMFLLYFGLMSMITPPIAIGSIVAARLADADMWKTGFLGMRFGITAYCLPFLWIYNPALLLQGTSLEITIVFSNTFMAAYLLKLSIYPSPSSYIPGWLYAKVVTLLALFVGAATIAFGSQSMFAILMTILGSILALFLNRAHSKLAIEQNNETISASINLSKVLK